MHKKIETSSIRSAYVETLRTRSRSGSFFCAITNDAKKGSRKHAQIGIFLRKQSTVANGKHFLHRFGRENIFVGIHRRRKGKVFVETA